MSSQHQTPSGPSSNVDPTPASHIVDFELNQARRVELTRELEASRSGTLSVFPKCSELRFDAIRLPSFMVVLITAAFLEWPTVEGFEAFVEKRLEYGEMMDAHVEDLRAVIREQLVITQGRNRAAKLAEERRVQEFQRALECMDPVEAEAARRVERERPFHRQRRMAARAAALEDECARERARVSAKFADF